VGSTRTQHNEPDIAPGILNGKGFTPFSAAGHTDAASIHGKTEETTCNNI
jgi:hypothetical protein